MTEVVAVVQLTSLHRPSHSAGLTPQPCSSHPGSSLRQDEMQAALRLDAAHSSSHLHSARTVDAALTLDCNCISACLHCWERFQLIDLTLLARLAAEGPGQLHLLQAVISFSKQFPGEIWLSVRLGRLTLSLDCHPAQATLACHAAAHAGTGREGACPRQEADQGEQELRHRSCDPACCEYCWHGTSAHTPQISIIVVAVFAILVTTYLATLRFRRPFSAIRNTDKPDSKLPSLFSWSRWRPGTRHEYSNTLQDTSYRGPGASDSARADMSGANDPERQSGTVGVDRNTSVRSVMTLPAYSRSVRENERVLGREGERAGMDNVVELPETQDEEETQRNQEMESLYQIRLARRAEAADREARRQARREARERGDHIALAEIRRRAEEAADLSVSQMLIAEHQGRNRDRRVSSVAYGDLGVARHDGTRVRANSHDSDNRPLLDSAASISGISGRSRGLTQTSTNTLDTHHRGLSVTSIGRSSVDSRASNDDFYPQALHSRSNSTHDVPSALPTQDPTPSTSPSHNADTSPHPLPTDDAPAYEDPPDYTSPVERRAPLLPRATSMSREPGTETGTDTGTSRGPPQLPSLERLPSIRVVTTAPTPVDAEPPSLFR